MSCSSKNPRFSVTRAIADANYGKLLFEEFKQFFMPDDELEEYNKYDKRYDTNYCYCSFRTRASPAFKNHYERFYPPDSIKRVPRDLVLTPLSIAVWFCDDGSSTVDNNTMTVKFSTDGFLKEDTEFLASLLEARYNKKFNVYKKVKDKEQYIVKASTKSCINLFTEIEPYAREFRNGKKNNLAK